MKRLIKYTFFLIITILSVIGLIAFLAYIDWIKNREHLLSNLREYYNKIKEPEIEYVVLDDEGKIIEVEPTKIYDRNNILIGVFSPSKRKIVQLYELPETLLKSLIYIEDRSFYSHYGFSVKGILRALIKNIISFRIVEGGSTITQQLSKILFTSRKRNIYRKFLELYGAIEIEKMFKKDEILLMYVNTVYLGHGCYGFKSAAELYFEKDIRTLNILEQTLLISLISAPNYYSPYNNPEICKAKHFRVVSSLAEAGLISKVNLEKRFETFWSDYNQKLKIPNVSFWKMELNRAPYVIEYIRRKLLDYFKPAEILQGGLQVYTTIDIQIEDTLREVALKNINEFITQQSNKDYYKDIEISAIVLEPETGDVLAFIGGKNFTFENQLIRAFDSKRQVGSSIKPLIYAAAFDTRVVTPVTIFTDKIIKYKDKNRIWMPQNYGNIYRGRVLLKDGLIQSINTISVQLLNLISPEYFVKYILNPIFYDTGIKKEFIPVLSLALGSCQMSAYELGICLSTIANSGHKVYPLVIKYILNREGSLLIDYESERAKKIEKWQKEGVYKIFSKGSSFIVNYISKNVFKEKGTGYYSALKKGLKIEIAGKTGTTQDYKDAWCSGWSKEFVAVVWSGFDDFRKSLGIGATGGIISAPIIIDLFNQLYLNKEFKDFSIPSDEIVFCDISKETGKLANAPSTNIEYNVPFLKGTEPLEY